MYHVRSRNENALSTPLDTRCGFAPARPTLLKLYTWDRYFPLRCPWRHPPVIASGLIEETMAMYLEATRKLSIAELLCVLNEKLDLEYPRVQETTPPLGVLAGSLEPKVRLRPITEHCC